MRRTLAIAALAGTALVLAGCSNQPDVEDIEDKAELRTVELEDGREIECLFYSATGAYSSWLAFDCNWNTSVPPLNG